ncbi:hypothetical protein BC629DRAFT_1275938 [Irpex lacteus]|nr:hypothetical protein BC629DRAFT_1275938 [Irpex lacteus]
MSTRVALVTGAAQGIGRAIALRLAKDGLDVALLDVPGKEEQVAAVAEEIKAAGRRSHCIVGDVSNEESVKSAVKSAVDNLGQLDVMVANAGILPNLGRSIVESKSLSPPWNIIFSVNALGTMLCFKHAAIQMIEQGTGGRLIGLANLGAYSASKFAVHGLTHVMGIADCFPARELKKHNITVNSYAPGMIYTAMVETPEDAAQGGRGAVIRSVLGMPPDTPAAEPHVVANLVSHIASPESDFITGWSLHGMLSPVLCPLNTTYS